jgi:uncharacterized delta-60 repeat protein
MTTTIRFIVGIVALAAAIVACNTIAGLGPPPNPANDQNDASVTDGGADTPDGGDAGDGGEGGAAGEGGDADAAIPADSGVLDPTFGEGGMATISSPGQIGPHGLAIDGNGNIVYCGAFLDPTMVDELLIGRLSPDGSPDMSFNASGRLIQQPPPGTAEGCNAVALVAGGDIVAAGGIYDGTSFRMSVSAFTAAGIVNTAIGDSGTGLVVLDSVDVNGQAVAMLSLPDNSILLGGVTGPAVNDPTMAHLSAMGVLDPTFGADGGATSDAGSAGDAGPPLDVLGLQGAGPITALLPRVTAGGYVAAVQSAGFLTLGITPGGTLDPSYGTGGQASAPLPTPLVSIVTDMVVQPNDGAAVCVGSTVNSIELVRFTADGQLDTTFGTHGRTSVTTSYQANAIARLPDGAFAVAVLTTGFAGAARFTKDGFLDTSFGNMGFAMLPMPWVTGNANSSNANTEAIAVDPTTGHIYVAVDSDSSPGLVIMRFAP